MYPAIFVNMNCIDELHYRLEQPDSWRYISKAPASQAFHGWPSWRVMHASYGLLLILLLVWQLCMLQRM